MARVELINIYKRFKPNITETAYPFPPCGIWCLVFCVLFEIYADIPAY